VVADACGDVSKEAHERAIERMVQAGARPMTSLQYLLELQRDWAGSETYEATTGSARTFGGAYGLGLIYAKTMLGPHASEAAKRRNRFHLATLAQAGVREPARFD
jgi:hypothetical protein